MKQLRLLVLLVGCAASVTFADTPVDVQVSTRPLQAVFVWALGKDVAATNDVELDIQEELIKHGVAGERSTKLFPKGMSGPTSAIVSRLRSTVCDSVLVVRKTRTVHWEANDAKIATLNSFIAQRGELLNPKDALEGSFSAPIVVQNITGNGDWEIIQGEALIFDLRSGKLLWHGHTQIKSAKDLPQSKYLQLVAEKVVQELETAGFVPPIKK